MVCTLYCIKVNEVPLAMKCIYDITLHVSVYQAGNQAVLLSPDGTCRLVKVAAGSGAELPGTGTASRPELRSGWAPCPKVQELARGMKPGSPAPPVPSASSSDTEGGGSAGKLSTGMKLLEEVERLRTTHVKYAHEAHAVLPVRVEQLWEEQVRQAEKVRRPASLLVPRCAAPPPSLCPAVVQRLHEEMAAWKGEGEVSTLGAQLTDRWLSGAFPEAPAAGRHPLALPGLRGEGAEAPRILRAARYALEEASPQVAHVGTLWDTGDDRQKSLPTKGWGGLRVCSAMPLGTDAILLSAAAVTNRPEPWDVPAVDLMWFDVSVDVWVSTCIRMCLEVWIRIWLGVCLGMWLDVRLDVRLDVSLGVCLGMWLDVRLGVRLGVCFGMWPDVQLNVRLGMLLNVRLDVRLGVCLGMWLDARLDVRLGVCLGMWLNVRLDVRLGVWPDVGSAACEEEELRDRAAKVEERNKAFAERIDRSIKVGNHGLHGWGGNHGLHGWEGNHGLHGWGGNHGLHGWGGNHGLNGWGGNHGLHGWGGNHGLHGAARGSGEALQAIHQLQPADRLGACGLLDADETPCLSCMDVVDLGEHAAGRSPLAAWTRSQMSQLVVAWGDALFCVRLPWLLAVAHSLGEEGVEDAEPLETASVEVLEEAAPTHGLLLEERPMSEEAPRATQLLLIDLSQAATSSTTTPVRCPTTPLARKLLAIRPELQVLQMEWHPSSDDHVAVLSWDGGTSIAFRLFSVAAPTVPEQEFLFKAQPSFAPTSFAFAPPEAWGYFTVLLASAEGAVHSLCP
eukprot:gene27720-34218_t